MAKILFCDDDPQMLEVMSRHLSWYGFDVDISDDPYQILSRLFLFNYDLFVCNAWMREVNGYSLCESLRSTDNPSVRSLKILMVAPENLDHEQYKMLKRRNIYFMTKYQSPEKWHEKIVNILQKSKK